MQQAIQLIVGLGNPGPQYQATRHNAGAWWVEQLAHNYHTPWSLEKKFKGRISKITVHGHSVYLLIPTTFMNLSGESVAAVAQFYQIPTTAILVAHDELDLPVGTVKLKIDGGGHGGHNGLRSIMTQLSGARDFIRLRIGIGHPGPAYDVSNYVLNKPTADEQNILNQSITESLAVLPEVLVGHYAKAMQVLHTTRSE